MAAQIWHDSNANGVQDAGEAGIAGAKVDLVRDIDGDGQFNSDGEILNTTTTDDNGNYTFAGLTPGVDYQVRFTTPTGFTGSSPRQVGEGEGAGDSDGAVSDVVVLDPGEFDKTLDSGFFKHASLGDRVWNDTDRDGVQDANETGRAGVRAELYTSVDGEPGTLVGTQITDANGNYKFTDLRPGDYVVKFIAPDGLMLTQQNAGDDVLDSDAGADGLTASVTLGSGEHNPTIDAGLVTKDQTSGDAVELCEDTSKAFNVFDNDIPGLKLINVRHESASLDNTFKSRGGAISFTDDGNVIYKSMTDYFGVDKLVYVAEDANGQRYTQTVDLQIDAVSDAPIAKGANYHPSSWERMYKEGGVQHWVHGVKLSDFGKFDDTADSLPTFGTYNKDNGVRGDIDSVTTIRLFGLIGANTGNLGDVVYRGKVLDFSTPNQFYDIPIADIRAGLLDIDFRKGFVQYNLSFKLIDSGNVANESCYPGSVVSGGSTFKLHTPIALDLNGDGKIGVTGETSSYQKDADAALGRTVQFDIDADGQKDTIEWFDGSGDGILIDNRDGLAAIDMDGERLFGDQGNTFGNGYYKLEQFDANGDGKLAGAELEGIALWLDNGDAVVQDGEIQTLAQQGITEISSTLQMTFDAQGKLHIQSSATRADGTELLTEDVFFAGTDGNAPELADMVGDDASLDGLLGSEAASRAAAPAEVEAGAYADAGEVLRRVMSSASEAAVAA